MIEHLSPRRWRCVRACVSGLPWRTKIGVSLGTRNFENFSDLEFFNSYSNRICRILRSRDQQ